MPHQAYILNPVPIAVDSREFKPPRYFRSLSRWLWNKLSSPVTTTVAKRVTLQEENILDLIRKDHRNLEGIWRNEIRHVIVGPEQLFAIEDESWIKSSINFHPLNLELANNGQRKVFGLHIHVVPWFDGILLLPDLPGMKEPLTKTQRFPKDALA